MKLVIDVEANSLNNPTKIWVIVCKDCDTGVHYVFRKVTEDETERQKFLQLASGCSYWIGHNILGYDYDVILRLIGFDLYSNNASIIDTLVVSKMANFSRKEGHSIESYGVEFGLAKGAISDFSKYQEEMVPYCTRDVDICHLIFKKYQRFIKRPENQAGIKLEHVFQSRVVTTLGKNGFAFNSKQAKKYLDKVNSELEKLDKDIKEQFPTKLKLVRVINPTLTKHGTLHKKDFKWFRDGDLSQFNGGPFCLCTWHEFNPASHKQIIDVLNAAKWKPEDKTKTHIETERELAKTKRSRSAPSPLDLTELSAKLETLKVYGWKINEHNLDTLPPDAPTAARTLAQRILYEARRRTLTEWLSLVQDDGRVHGHFQGIGAWTQRMAHQAPNTANITNEYDTSGKKKLLGKEMRALWCAPPRRLLVGVDAEGIQLRIFAHYINDPEFTDSLVRGKKEDKSDPHSLNQRILGEVCKTRAAAKRFIYALLLGAGLGKLAEVLECPSSDAQSALDRLMDRYQGFLQLKTSRIPKDAARGWFEGLDGRQVPILGDTESNRRHLAMSGYLQNGEAVVMKKSTLWWMDKLIEEDILDWLVVNFVHDEWQTECCNDFKIALRIAEIQAESLRVVGEQLNLNCPLAGSYWNEDAKDYTIGVNWSQTH